MDQSKEEILGNIQRLEKRRRQQAADLKGQREDLAEIEADLPAKKELQDLAAKTAAAGARLKEQRNNSEEWMKQKQAVQEGAVDLDITADTLSDNLIRYMVMTKQKSVHVFPSEEASINREIVTSARVGQKVPANLSLFDEEESA